MTFVNMHDAKSQLSRLVDAVERGDVAEVIIARNGRPAARLTPIASTANAGVRIGIAKGLFTAPADPHALDDEVADLFRKSIAGGGS